MLLLATAVAMATVMTAVLAMATAAAPRLWQTQARSGLAALRPATQEATATATITVVVRAAAADGMPAVVAMHLLLLVVVWALAVC
jgi:hypothetical protein